MIRSILSKDLLAQAVVSSLSMQRQLLLKKKKQVVMGICGGRSIQGVFYLFKQGSFDFTNIHLFWVDERLVSPDDKESNYRLAKESFIDDLIAQKKILPTQIHPFHGDAKNIQHETLRYSEELLRLGGFDVVLLGAGEDGHVGALFPGHALLKKADPLFYTLADSPKLPAARMTASRGLLSMATYAHAFCIGEEKKQTLKNYSDPKMGIMHCPLKLINGNKEPTLWTDILWKI